MILKNAIKSIYEFRENEIQSLNGIRALAILLVLVFHYTEGTFAVGIFKEINPVLLTIFENFRSGVDLFFILSGFLITGELYYRWKTNRGNYFKSFYIKRCFRIFPAYYFYIIFSIILLSTSIAAMKSAPKTDLNTLQLQFYQAQLSCIKFDFLYLVNFFRGTNLHTWSLAVEQQFYIFFPVIAYFFLFKLKSGKRLAVLAFFYVILLIVQLLLIYNFNEANFNTPEYPNHYLTERMRFGSIIIGIIIMDLYYNRKEFISKLTGLRLTILTVIGLTIVAASHLYNYYLPYKVMFTLRFNFYAIGFGILFLVAITERNFISKFLSMKIFVPIARISYTIYLWHIISPVFALNPFINIHTTRLNYFTFTLYFFVYFAITFIFCSFLYVLIEYPFLKLKDKLTGKA